jgi:1,4-dihydroxy-2-naphthoyl-CoA hydrolase
MAPIWHRRPTLADLQTMATGTAIAHVGIEFMEVGDGSLTARMPVDQRTIQPYGLLHGGASVLLAETLGSAAAHHCVDDQNFLTVGIAINANHVRGVREGWFMEPLGHFTSVEPHSSGRSESSMIPLGSSAHPV